jgi:hypothetical protein
LSTTIDFVEPAYDVGVIQELNELRIAIPGHLWDVDVTVGREKIFESIVRSCGHGASSPAADAILAE